MSIQAGWNSALGIVGGLSALQKGNKLQEYQSVLDAKKLSDEEIKQGTEEFEAIKKELPKDTPIEEIQKLGKELAGIRKNELENKVYYEGMPKSMKKAFDKGRDVSLIGTMEELGDRGQFYRNVFATKEKYGGYGGQEAQAQRNATYRAQQAAQIADSAPKNTMNPIIEQLRKNTMNIPNITGMKGGEE